MMKYKPSIYLKLLKVYFNPKYPLRCRESVNVLSEAAAYLGRDSIQMILGLFLLPG